MALNYRDEKGASISFGAWEILRTREDITKSKQSVLKYMDYDITITKRYIGNAQKIYLVEVECSEDIIKYAGYKVPYQGEVSAENDYQRILSAVLRGQDIYDDTVVSENGMIAIFYDARYDAHIVNVLNAPEAYTYRVDKADGNTSRRQTAKEVAQAKFDELTGVE